MEGWSHGARPGAQGQRRRDPRAPRCREPDADEGPITPGKHAALGWKHLCSFWLSVMGCVLRPGGADLVKMARFPAGEKQERDGPEATRRGWPTKPQAADGLSERSTENQPLAWTLRRPLMHSGRVTSVQLWGESLSQGCKKKEVAEVRRQRAPATPKEVCTERSRKIDQMLKRTRGQGGNVLTFTGLISKMGAITACV